MLDGVYYVPGFPPLFLFLSLFLSLILDLHFTFCIQRSTYLLCPEFHLVLLCFDSHAACQDQLATGLPQWREPAANPSLESRLDGSDFPSRVFSSSSAFSFLPTFSVFTELLRPLQNHLISYFSPSVLSRAATARAQLTVTTSSTKRRKVAEPSSPGSLPGLTIASQANDSRHGSNPGVSFPLPPSPGRSTPAPDSHRSRSSSESPSSYVPAHLTVDLGDSTPNSRCQTPESGDTAPEDPSTACAGLSLSNDPVTDMTAPEKRDGSVPPPSGDEARSSSPGVKRTAAEITEPDHEVGKGAGSAGDNLRSDSINTDSSDTADNDNRSGNHTSSTPASMATDTTPPATRDGSKAETEGIPSIDDQVAMVNCAAAQPLKENQKGYVVSMSWLKKVYARSTSYTEKAGGSATEENIGPVDNSDIVRNIEISNSVNDEAGDAYVPLFPTARSAVDFEVVPQKGWDMIMKWYGLAHGSPVIVRYAHNINRAGDVENIQYEINPPIFTIFKLSNPAEGTTPQTLKDKSTPPPRLMATRASNFQQWLKRVKGLANVKMSTKVRLWKIQISSAQGSSAAVTPGASRSASPAPATLNIASLGNCLMMDLNTFLSLPEDQRVLLRDVTDQTANSNYNGKMTLGFAGLEENEEILVLEESLGGKGSQWVTEASQKDLARYGASTGNTSAGSAKVTPRPKSKAKDAAPSQPVPAKRAPRRTRGFGGKPLGCTGLNNVGNTCYMSAALQCMQHVEELTRYFLSE